MTDLEKKYDEICGWAFINLYSHCKNRATLTLSQFDPKNEEHLFVLSVARGVATIYDKPLRLDVSKFQLWNLNKKIKDKTCKLQKANEEDIVDSLVPEKFLEFMRPTAEKVCGNDFDFGKIYNCFYKTERTNK